MISISRWRIYLLNSFYMRGLILDVFFTAEEVKTVVMHLKKRKSPGPDGLVAEHLQGRGSL